MIRYSVLVATCLVLLAGILAFGFRLFDLAARGPSAPIVHQAWTPDRIANRLQSNDPRTRNPSGSATLDRPLFYKGRDYPKREVPVASLEPSPVVQPVERPVVRLPAPPPRAPSISIDRLRLLGIVVAGGERQALVEIQGKSTAWFREKARIEDWEVDKVDVDRVLLRSGTFTGELELYRSAKSN